MAEEFRVLRPREYHSQLVLKGKRVDGRKLEESRDVKLETDAIRTADSSSLIKLGNTSLVCGCTSKILKYRDNGEDNEEIKIRLELPPICSSPTGYQTQNTAQLLTKTLRDILDNSNCIDKQSFHLEEFDSYWSVDVEIICLNYDGSLIDVALLAVLSALKSMKLTSGFSNIQSRSIKMNTTPICSSFALIGDQIICDPNLEEETVAQSTFSITVDPQTNMACHINKIGGKALSSVELFKCIELAKKRAAELKKIITIEQFEPKMECN